MWMFICVQICCLIGHVSTCDAGQYVFRGSCVPCQASCKACTPTGGCTECFPGAFSRQDKCLSCPTGCLECTSEFSCSTCKSGHFGNTCENECAAGCVDNTCDIATGSCVFGCLEGHFGQNCSRCPEICADCTDSSTEITCITCKDGFFGASCEERCMNCQNNTCFINNGSCVEGCDDRSFLDGETCVGKFHMFYHGILPAICLTTVLVLSGLVGCITRGANKRLMTRSLDGSGVRINTENGDASRSSDHEVDHNAHGQPEVSVRRSLSDVGDTTLQDTENSDDYEIPDELSDEEKLVSEGCYLTPSICTISSPPSLISLLARPHFLPSRPRSPSPFQFPPQPRPLSPVTQQRHSPQPCSTSTRLPNISSGPNSRLPHPYPVLPRPYPVLPRPHPVLPHPLSHELLASSRPLLAPADSYPVTTPQMVKQYQTLYNDGDSNMYIQLNSETTSLDDDVTMFQPDVDYCDSKDMTLLDCKCNNTERNVTSPDDNYYNIENKLTPPDGNYYNIDENETSLDDIYYNINGAKTSHDGIYCNTMTSSRGHARFLPPPSSNSTL